MRLARVDEVAPATTHGGPPVITLPPRARRWYRREWLGVYLATAAAAALAFTAAALSGNDFLVPAGILLGASAGPLAFLVWNQAWSRCLSAVRPGDLLGTMLYGGTVGVVIGGVLDQAFIQPDGPSLLWVGLFEEPAKLVVPVALLALGRYRSVEAALGLALASATGFAVLESMAYGMAAWTEEGGIASAATVLVLRSLTSPFAHLAWTGIAMLVLARARAAGAGWGIRAWWGLAVAIVLHSLFDVSPGALPALVGLQVFVTVVGLSLVLFLWLARGLWWSSLSPEGQPCVATVVRAAVPARPSAPRAMHSRPRRRPGNGLGVAALCCGIAGLFVPLLGIAAVAFGASARGQARREGSGAPGRATVGLVLGVLGAGFWTPVIVAAALA